MPGLGLERSNCGRRPQWVQTLAPHLYIRIAFGPQWILAEIRCAIPDDEEVAHNLATSCAIAFPWNQIPRLSRQKPTEGAGCLPSPLGGLDCDSAGRFDRPDGYRASFETASSCPGSRRAAVD